MENLQIRRALSSWDWSAILAGVAVAMAIRFFLSLLGAAVGLTVGNEVLGGGYAVYAVLVQLLALAMGAATAAMLAHVDSATQGAWVGAFTWVVVVSLSGLLPGSPLLPQTLTSAAWGAFMGALLSLATAILGGAIGCQKVTQTGRFTPTTPGARPTPSLPT